MSLKWKAYLSMQFCYSSTIFLNVSGSFMSHRSLFSIAEMIYIVETERKRFITITENADSKITFQSQFLHFMHNLSI